MKSGLRNVAQWSLFPLLLGSSVVITCELLRAGVAVPLAVFGVLVPFSGLIHLLERGLPYRPAWKHPDANVRTDLPLEKAVMMLPEVLPFIILGAGREVTALFFVANGIIGLLQHCNVDLRLGWLNYVFSMVEPHRWHHTREIAQSNTNYGSNLSIWDVVFGTFYLPRNEKAERWACSIRTTRKATRPS